MNIIPTAALHVLTDGQLSTLGLDPQLTVVADIVNNTGRELTVVTRSGLRFILPSHRVSVQRSIYFREGFELSTQGNVLLNPTDAPFDKTPSPAERIYDTLSRSLASRDGYTRRKIGRVLHELTMEKLMDSGGSLYIQEVDVVVSMHNQRAVIHHPFSMEGLMGEMKTLEFDSASLRMALYINDNRGRYSDRYLNWLGRIFRVPCRKMPGRADGFYAVHPRPSLTAGTEIEYETVYMPVEEAEAAYGLYRSPDDAVTYGFSKEALENENLRIKRDTVLRAAEREETSEQRKERTRIEAEEIQRAKARHEIKELHRKEWMELLKTGIQVATIVIGIATTAVKLGTAIASSKTK